MRHPFMRFGLWMAVVPAIWLCQSARGDGWQAAPSLNVPNEWFGCAVDEFGTIWVVIGWNRTGGCSGSGPMVESIERLAYDGQSYPDQWELTSIVPPTPRRLHSMVISRGFIYIFGGYDNALGIPDEIPLATVDRYDILKETWSSWAVPPMCGPIKPTQDGGAIADRLGRIWVIGGQTAAGNGQYTTTAVEVFDPSRPELGWQQGPPLNHARARFGCVSDRDGRIFVIGGYGPGSTHIASVEYIDPLRSTEWTVLPAQLPDPVSNDAESAVGADGRIYVAGGWANNSLQSRVLSLDPAATSGVWEEEPAMSTPRTSHRIVLGHDGYIYAIGGDVSGCVSTTSVEKLNSNPPPCVHEPAGGVGPFRSKWDLLTPQPHFHE